MLSGCVSVSRSLLPLQVAFAGNEAIAPEMAFLETQALDLRPHGPVEHEDALAAPPLRAP